MAITTYTDQEMLDITRKAIYDITSAERDETGTAGRKEVRLRLEALYKQEEKYEEKVSKAARTTAQKKPVVVRFRSPS